MSRRTAVVPVLLLVIGGLIAIPAGVALAGEPADAYATADDVQTETDADISLEIDPGFGLKYAGEPFVIAVKVFNAGPAPVTGATAVLRLPAGLAVVSAGFSCVPDGTGSVCTIGPMSLPPAAGSTALVLLEASAAGDYPITGSVTADQPDPQPANNADSAVVTVLPSADLAVTIAESADPSRPGKAFTYTVTVTNDGPSPASAVRLTDGWSAAVSGGVELLSVAATQGRCVAVAASRIECDLGELAAGATAIVTVQLRPRGVGSVSDEARVTATEHDGDPADNLATETTTVR